MRFPALPLLCLALLAPLPAAAQTWTRIVDVLNPLANHVGVAGYYGVSWIDYDGDGDLDLFANPGSLYRNDGGGTFASVATVIGIGQLSLNPGNAWADYDNDGDLDVYTSGIPSYLYRNVGGGLFTQILTGAIGNGNANRAWSCSWADMDNDGDADLFLTSPCGFVGNPCLTNLVYLNDGPPNYTFTKQDTGVVVTGFAAYTVGTWSDYDLDGDQDLFIGSGPATNVSAVDNLYRNQFVETGDAGFFTRITTSPIATDLLDGQMWNWVDYDHDRDLDGYVTNWGAGGSVTINRLYRNDGGVYVDPAAGAIDAELRVSLGSLWGDYDNDGDLDCYVTNDVGQRDSHYRNNGLGSFTSVISGPSAENITHRGGSNADYDGDGDLDLFLGGPGTDSRLYRNDTANGNGWIQVHCVGTVSNRAAIGARVELRAVISGTPRWQMREVSSQNTFNGHNMLTTHFGLGNAAAVDTALVHWPSGTVDTLVNLAINTKHVVTETVPAIVSVDQALPSGAALALLGVSPHPFRDRARVAFSIAEAGPVRVEVFDVGGRLIQTPLAERLEPGRHEVTLDGAAFGPGLYFYRVTAGHAVRSGKLMRIE
jgi:hypothetical protein